MNWQDVWKTIWRDGNENIAKHQLLILMAILLVSPDYGNKRNNIPWGTLSIGTYLTGVKGLKNVHLLDASLYSENEFLQELKYYCNNGVKLVGISFMSTDAYFAKNTSDYIKSINKDIKIIVGGPHAMLKPEQACLYKNIDFVAYAEGETTVSALLEKIERGDDEYRNVPGLVYKNGSKIERTDPAQPIEFYDINYGLLAENVRRSFSDYIQILTGRGCSFKCTFCFNSVCGQKWRGRTMPEIVNEIDKIVDKYNTKVIYFRDENFFSSPDRIREFIKYYREKRYKFEWRANCRASYYNENYINLELLKELGAINCRVLKFGIESGSQRVLNYLKKGTRIENIKEMICAFGKVKSITPSYSFIIGIPTETPEEYMSTLNLINFIAKYNPDAKIIGPQYFRIYPGGELYEEVLRDYHYSEPVLFEEWASRHSPDRDTCGLSKDISYPWIKPGYAYLAQHVDTLVLFFQQDIRRYLTLRLIWHVPFILLARIRLKFGWYGALYEIKLAIFMRKLKLRL